MSFSVATGQRSTRDPEEQGGMQQGWAAGKGGTAWATPVQVQGGAEPGAARGSSMWECALEPAGREDAGSCPFCTLGPLKPSSVRGQELQRRGKAALKHPTGGMIRVCAGAVSRGWSQLCNPVLSYLADKARFNTCELLFFFAMACWLVFQIVLKFMTDWQYCHKHFTCASVMQIPPEMLCTRCPIFERNREAGTPSFLSHTQNKQYTLQHNRHVRFTVCFILPPLFSKNS